MFQASYQPCFAGIDSNQGTIAAFNGRVCHHQNTGQVNSLTYAPRQLSALETVNHCRKAVAKSCLRGSYKPAISLYESNPCAVISPGLDKVIASSLKQSFPVLYLDNKLIHIAYGLKDGVEVDNALLCMFSYFYLFL